MSEVKKLLGKAAIKVVPFADRQQGFNSTFFLVTKKTGNYRAVINLRPPKSVSQDTSFQDEHYENSSESSKESRLGFFCRPEGCLLSHFNSPKPQKISTLLHKRGGLSVPSAEGVHKSGSCGGCSFENAEHKSRSVFERLVGIKCNTTNASQGQKKNTSAFFSTRFLDKFRNVKSGTNTRYHLFGLDKRIVLPTPDRMLKLREVVTNLMGKVVHARQYLQTLSVMASCIELIPNARLYMRPVQLHPLHWWKPMSRYLKGLIPSSQHL